MIDIGALVDKSDCKEKLSASAIRALRGKKSFFQRGKNWAESRRKLLTASDVAVAINDQMYADEFFNHIKSSLGNMSREKLIQRKVRGQSLKSTLPMQHGVKYERVAIDKLVSEYGVDVLMWDRENKNKGALDLGLCVHPSYDHIAGSPDALTASGQLIEVKCPYALHKQQNMKPGYVPRQHQVQILLCNQYVNFLHIM